MRGPASSSRASMMNNFLTHALTIMRVSLRHLISRNPANEALEMRNRDIHQAFYQTESKLRRKVYIHPSPLLGYPSVSCSRHFIPSTNCPSRPLTGFKHTAATTKTNLTCCRQITIRALCTRPDVSQSPHALHISRRKWSVSRLRIRHKLVARPSQTGKNRKERSLALNQRSMSKTANSSTLTARPSAATAAPTLA